MDIFTFLLYVVLIGLTIYMVYSLFKDWREQRAARKLDRATPSRFQTKHGQRGRRGK